MLTILNSFLFSYDQQLSAKSSHKAPPPATISQIQLNNKNSKSLDTQQFGVSLMFIKERNNGDIIPPIMRQCVEYLSQPEGTIIMIRDSSTLFT